MGTRRGLRLDLAIPGGAAICEAVATFEGCWGVQHSDALRGLRLDIAIPGGGAICETVATFEGCWGSQHSGYLPQIHSGPRHPGGLQSVQLSPLSRAAGEASIVGTCRRFRLDLAILGGCDL